MQDALQFARMFLDVQRKTVAGCRAMQYDMDIGAWERHWPAMRQRCAGTFSPVGPLDILFFPHVDEVASVCRLFALFWRYDDE